MKHLAGWLKNLRGATAIEYSLVAAGIALTIAATIFAFGDELYALLYVPVMEMWQ